MIWAPRLKRVSPKAGASADIDIITCDSCRGTVKVIADTSDRSIKEIVGSRWRDQADTCPSGEKALSIEFNPLPESRAPPQRYLFG